MICTCEQSGYCERYKMQMFGRMYDICQDRVLTPEKCEAYRHLWLAEVEGRPAPQFPPITEQVQNFATALAKWQSAGRPRRTEEEMATLQAICDGCEQYMREEKRCGACGCFLETSSLPYLLQMADMPGKLSARTERCPWQTPEHPNGKWPLELVTITDGD